MSDTPRRTPLAPLRACVDEAKTDNKNYRHKQRDLITKTNLHPETPPALMPQDTAVREMYSSAHTMA
jgi:hypothetical protein